MKRAFSAAWLLALVLTVAIGGFGLFFFGLAGDRSGQRILPSPDVRLELLREDNRVVTWPAVRELPADAWQAWTRDYYLHAPGRTPLWIRATFTNRSAEALHGVLLDAEFNADLIECWSPDPVAPGGWRAQRAGEVVRGDLKPIWGREAAFPLTIAPRGETVVYLRAEDRFGLWLRLVWWPEARVYASAQIRDLVVESMYFGVLVALFIYNSVLWSRLRHRDLAYYLCYLTSMGVFMVAARSWPQVLGWPVASPELDVLGPGALAASCVFIVQFAREFFGLRHLMPRVDAAYRWLGWIWIGLFLGCFSMLWAKTTLWVHVSVIGTVATHVTLVLTALVAWRSGARHAKYFVLSFGVFLLGSSPQAYHWIRAIPLGTTGYPLLFGSALEMMLLSFAVADRFSRLERGRHAAELAEEQARLESLRYQLNPHFLFNALNSIYGLVLPHSAPAADLVRRLADFCRDTLTRPGGQWQPLGDELAMLRNYLGIEQARWRDRLTLEYDLDPRADDLAVPPFLLLPLIDNAIKHGAATSPGRLCVRLASRREADGAVTLLIANTGEWKPTAAPVRESTGVGLENIRARLQHAFGGAHSLTTHAADGWVTLTLRLPATPMRTTRLSTSPWSTP
jgi:hypothetical protein